MNRVLVIGIVLSALAGCDRITPASTTPTPSPSTHLQLPSAPPVAATHEGLASGFCERWQTTPLDLTSLHAGPNDVVSAERDGRGGLTLAAAGADGSVTAAAITGAGIGETVHIVPPGSVQAPDLVLRHVQAAPDGAWVVAWSTGVARRAFDGSITAIDDGVDSDIGVSEDGWVGIHDARGIRYVPLGGGAPTIVASRDLFGLASSAWFDGRFVGLVEAPDASIEIVSRDGSFDAVPLPLVDVLTPSEPIFGADGSFGAILHEANSDTVDVTLTTLDVPVAEYTLDLAFEVWGGATTRAASDGVVLVGAQRGVTGAASAPVELAEVAPDGARSAITTLGTIPATPTTIIVAATSDGDTILVYAANASLGRVWVTQCDGGGV